MKTCKLTICLLTIITGGVNSLASADDREKCQVRAQDQMWFFSSRGLGCPPNRDDADIRLDVRSYGGQQGWSESTLNQFLEPSVDDSKPVVVIFVHGNRKDVGDSFNDGWRAYRQLVLGADPGRAVKFVIWSWPSQRNRRGRHDARVKSVRSDTDAYYLGWLLSQIDAEVPVSLVGHSLGARVILGGLHVSSGGELCGRQLAISDTQAISRVRVALLAAAEHNHWLTPGHKHDHAYLRINRMLVLYDTCDPVLRWYPTIDQCSKADAMGYTGAVGLSKLEDGGARIDQMNVRCILGCTHSVCEYFSSKALLDRISPYVFWNPIAEE